ncbi:IS3 family transposase [Streptomyces violascens]|uniref:IS3 family transposase n=1 Tax=Streptomyces violascens TaxID=67381 RepID=UPI0036890FB9
MNAIYTFIEAEKTTHDVAFLCRLLNVARSSFYAWCSAAKARAARKAADDALAHEITVLHIASRKTYGVPRIHAELRRLGRRINRKRIERIMREQGIQGAHRRKRRSLTRPDKKARPAPDLKAATGLSARGPHRPGDAGPPPRLRCPEGRNAPLLAGRNS